MMPEWTSPPRVSPDGATSARPAQLAATKLSLAAARQVPAWLADTEYPLGFLVHPDCTSNVIDAA